MQPTATEQLILQMLCDIHKKLEITGSFDPDLISQAISSDDWWVIDWKYGIKDEGDRRPAHVTAVVDTLDMFAFLRDSFERLGADGQAEVEAAIPHARTRIVFSGYDGNNETEYLSVAHYLTQHLGAFESMRDVAARNSHFPATEMYARMFEVFELIRPNLVGRLMSAEEIIAVLTAATHPSNR